MCSLRHAFYFLFSFVLITVCSTCRRNHILDTNTGDDNCPDDQYDPRLRPWYVQALANAPMDVIIVIDKSGSMTVNKRMETTKSAVKSILSMLRPYDRFSVVPFDSEAEAVINTGAVCMDEKKLAFATSNVNQMKAFVETIQPGGGTMYSYALRFAREIFEASLKGA